MCYCLTKAKLSQGVSVAKLHRLGDNNSQMNLFVWDIGGRWASMQKAPTSDSV